ncbi:putative inorganic phosphate cotransporter, partial [Trichogramma pretiosum]|uniref:putative inorganic phosphate cotransporter n=1 Tax=Trichogramma pretiosum TaxID=7493 RepID=UPI000C719746
MSSNDNVSSFKVSQKWVFAILSFMGIFISSALRAVLPIAITEMIKHAEESNFTSSEIFNTSEIQVEKDEVYDWDEYTQGLVLSSFYWGYATIQFFFGSLSERFGGKYMFGQSILIPAIFTYFTPIIIQSGGSMALVISRALMGMSNCGTYPAISTMITEWTIPSERSKFATAIYAAFIPGMIFSTTGSALIIEHSGLGWPGAFEIFGVFGIVWFVAWVFLCYNNVESHPFISQQEKKYFQENLQSQKQSKLPPAPYKHIMLSKEFWAFAIGLIGHSWLFYLISSDLPKYMSSVVGYSVEDNGYLISIAYLFMWLNTIFSSWISDAVLAKNLMSVTALRKVIGTVALTGPAFCIIGASYIETNRVLVVALFVMGMLLMGSTYSSILVNGLDLSPNYAGTVMAIGNGLSAICGILTPYFVGVLTPNQTAGEWRLVFWLGFVITIISNLIYVLYVSGKVQKWDNYNCDKK